MILLWIMLGILYLVIAFCMIRNFSYCCCLTYGVYEYSFLTVIAGLFFPITILTMIIRSWFE